MAIATWFDLELIQYDAVNAFVHAKLDENHGYRKPGKIYVENKFIIIFKLFRKRLSWIGSDLMRNRTTAISKLIQNVF